MSVTAVAGALYVLAIYLAIGVLVAVPFLIAGISRIDPAARNTSWTFRVLVLPGVIAMWPFLLWRWVRSGGAK